MSNLSNDSIRNCIDKPLENWLSRGEIMDALRELLARREAEGVPVAWMVGDATLYNPDTVESYVKRSGLPVIPLFAGVPLPVVPDKRVLCDNQDHSTGKLCMRISGHYGACTLSRNMVNSPVTPDGWTDNDAANSALVMLGRIDTLDSVDDSRIEEVKRIIRHLAAAPKPQ